LAVGDELGDSIGMAARRVTPPKEGMRRGRGRERRRVREKLLTNANGIPKGR
jgi:hypothetical protein